MLGLKLPFNGIDKEVETIFSKWYDWKLRLITKKEISKDHWQLAYKLPIGVTLGEFVEKLETISFLKGEIVLNKYFEVGEADVLLDVFTGLLPREVSFKEFLKVKPPSNSVVHIPIGISRRGIEWIKLTHPNAHLLMAGMPSYGKTNMIRFILWYLDLHYKSKTELYLLTPVHHSPEYNDLKSVGQVDIHHERELANLVDFFNKLEEEMQQRYEHLAQAKVESFEAFNAKHPEIALKHIVVCIDEVSWFEYRELKNLQQALDKIINIGGSVGISLILSTQRPSVGVITPSMKWIPNVLAFRTKNKFTSQMLINNNRAYLNIKDRGRAILDMAYPKHQQVLVQTPNMHYFGEERSK